MQSSPTLFSLRIGDLICHKGQREFARQSTASNLWFEIGATTLHGAQRRCRNCPACNCCIVGQCSIVP
jgi:hypothetical protein